MIWRATVALVFLTRFFLRWRNWEQLHHVATRSLRRYRTDIWPTKVFVLLTGHPGSGKTTLCRSHPVLSRCIHFDGDRLHELIARQWPNLFLQSNDRGVERGVIIAVGMLLGFWTVSKRPQAVVYDYVNYHPWRRQIALSAMKARGYYRVIIWADCKQGERTVRLQSDPGRQSSTAKAGLDRLINFKVRLGHGPPQSNEADVFIHYRSHVLRPEELRLPQVFQAPMEPDVRTRTAQSWPT